MSQPSEGRSWSAPAVATGAWLRLGLLSAAAVYVAVLSKVYFDKLAQSEALGASAPGAVLAPLCWVLAVLPACWMPIALSRPSQVIYWFLYIVVYVPAELLAIYSLSIDAGTTLLFLLCLCLCFFLVGQIYRLDAPRIVVLRVPPFVFWLALWALLIGSDMYVLSVSGLHLAIVSLQDVYSVRATFADTVDSSSVLVDYLVSWQVGAIHPFLIAYGLVFRKPWLVAVGTLGQVFVYATTGFRTALFSAVLLVIVLLVVHTQRRRFGLLVVVGVTALIECAVLVDERLGSDVWTDILVHRILALPGQLTGYYFEFFSRNEQAHLGESIFRLLVHYPYSLSVPALIGETYLGGSWANANIWADAFAQFGYLGLFVFTLALAVVLLVFDGLVAGEDVRFPALLAASPAWMFANSALLTSLLTGGVGLLLLLVYAMPRRARREVERRARIVPEEDAATTDNFTGERLPSAERGAPHLVVSGKLQSTALGSLIAALGQLCLPGCLWIAEGATRGAIFFGQGSVVGAMFGTARGLAALEGIAIVLRKGQFVFSTGEAEQVPDLNLNLNLELSEVQRYLDAFAEDGALVETYIPSLNASPRVSDLQTAPGEAPLLLTRRAVSLLVRVDGRRTVGDLADGSLSVVRELARLVQLGLAQFDLAASGEKEAIQWQTWRSPSDSQTCRPALVPAGAPRSPHRSSAARSSGRGPMTTRRYVATLRRWWWLPVVGVLAASSISFVVTMRLRPLYEATTILLVTMSSAEGVPTSGDSQFTQLAVKTYSQIATTPSVLDAVVERLRLPVTVQDLARVVTVQPVRDTQLLSISVRGADPALTRDIADTLAGVFIEQQTRRLEQHQVFSTVNVVQPALVPLQPIEPRPVVNVLASAAAALFVTLGLAYLLDRLDDVIRTSADIDLDGDVPILGVMPELSLAAQPQRPETLESLRTLRTMFELTTRDRPPASLLVTSAGSGEGKSTTAIGLSIMLARADKRVVLLDAHRARPSLHEVLDLDNDRGLTTLLRRASGGADESVRECLQRTAEPNLSVLTFGPPLPDAVDLSSRGLASVLRALEGEADIVVVDGPSTLEAADGLILAQHVHATVLVARAGATRLEALAGALTALDPVGTDVLGIVLNATGAKPSGWPVIEAMTSQLASLSTSRTASPCD